MVRVVGEGFPTEALVDFTTTKYVARISGYYLEKYFPVRTESTKRYNTIWKF